jgi:aspartate 1-decarboxylase
MKSGELVIIASRAAMTDDEAMRFESKRVFVNHENRIRD